MRYLMLFFVAIYFVSCTNELDLVADKKVVPVVYALIDQADTAQYVRVEKIFVDKVIKPEIIAQNPDSLYFDNITVKLVRKKDGIEYILEKVDGNLEGHVREDGIFANAPNYLYKIKTENIPLIENEEIELRIDGIFDDISVKSSATLLEAPFLFNPQDGGLLSFLPNKKINIAWTPKGDIKPEIFTVTFYFNISETISGIKTDKQLTWVVSTNTDKTILETDGRDFYSFLVGALTKDDAIKRVFNSIEFELISGNTTVADYIRVGQANLGITSSGEVPKLSNVSGGLGLFGTTHTHRRREIMLAAESRDSLINGSITAELNFQ